MNTIDVHDAEEPLRDYARSIGAEPLLIQESGRTIAALLPVDEVDVESLMLATDSSFLRIIAEARRQQRAGQAVASDEVRRKLGLCG